MINQTQLPNVLFIVFDSLRADKFFIGSETYLPNDIKKSYFLTITKKISINSLKILPLKYKQNLLSNLNNEIIL